MLVVQINLSKFIFFSDILSNKSWDPTKSAPKLLASLVFSCSHKTAILYFLPLPFGSFVTVLKLKSPPFDCFKLILTLTSMDSSNLVVQFSQLELIYLLGMELI